MDFSLISVLFIFVKSHFRWGRVAKIIVLQVPEFNGFFIDFGIKFSPQINDFSVDISLNFHAFSEPPSGDHF